MNSDFLKQLGIHCDEDIQQLDPRLREKIETVQKRHAFRTMIQHCAAELHGAVLGRNHIYGQKLSSEVVAAFEASSASTSGFERVFIDCAIIARRQKQLEREVEVLTLYIRLLGHEPAKSIECDVADRLKEAQEMIHKHVPERGMCESCLRQGLVLSRNKHGTCLCRTCGARFHREQEARIKIRSYEIVKWKRVGLNVPEKLDAATVARLRFIATRRAIGLSDDAPESEVQEYYRPKPEVFYTKIAGVSYPNADGTQRQQIIDKCTIGEKLLLVREPQNPANPKAIGVFRSNGEQLGYISIGVGGDSEGSTLPTLAERIDDGFEVSVLIANIPGQPGQRGVNIQVTVPPYSAKHAAMLALQDEHFRSLQSRND